MKNENRGITLIETLIYIALFGIIMIGSVTATWQVMEGGRKNETVIAVEQEGTFLMRKINWALSGASNVMTNGSSTLTITRPDLATLIPSQSPITISASGTSMMLARGGSPAQPLNDDAYAVTQVTFSVTPASTNMPTSTTVHFLVRDTPFTFTTYAH